MSLFTDRISPRVAQAAAQHSTAQEANGSTLTLGFGAENAGTSASLAAAAAISACSSGIFGAPSGISAPGASSDQPQVVHVNPAAVQVHHPTAAAPLPVSVPVPLPVSVPVPVLAQTPSAKMAGVNPKAAPVAVAADRVKAASGNAAAPNKNKRAKQSELTPMEEDGESSDPEIMPDGPDDC